MLLIHFSLMCIKLVPVFPTYSSAPASQESPQALAFLFTSLHSSQLFLQHGPWIPQGTLRMQPDILSQIWVSALDTWLGLGTFPCT